MFVCVAVQGVSASRRPLCWRVVCALARSLAVPCCAMARESLAELRLRRATCSTPSDGRHRQDGNDEKVIEKQHFYVL